MRRQGALLAGAVSVGLLVGCTAESPAVTPTAASSTAAPSATPSAPQSPTATPSPAPADDTFDASVPPTAPAALDGPPSKKAAGEAAAYFIQLIPYLGATGDFVVWDAMSGKYCDYCANAREMVQGQIYQSQRAVGGQIEILHTELFDYRKNQYAVVLTIRENPYRLLNRDGSVEEEARESTGGTVHMVMRWGGDSWTVESVGLRQSS